MIADNYENEDGYKLSLTDDERALVLENLEVRDSEFGWILASYCGLRTHSIAGVRFEDIIKRETGDWVVRVYEENEKTNEYRETPIPTRHAIRIKTTQEADDELEPSDRVVQESMRTFRRHISQVGEELAEEEDEMFRHLSPHDGRATFINNMLDNNVQELQVMEWSGHDDWRTFRDHYLTGLLHNSAKHVDDEAVKKAV
ncbi:phage integrase family protein [Haloarcula quadrata]|uniref:Phage integrase family protein n=1 Tax=Haloarcula quadrata TaxID=182779 RepID=A0A495R9F8_9EURY|nr:site-specific integrase [Haloarcula quadrata]RKS83488.1 phage integrase family protein [Haloarcula quadrata]